MTQSSGIIRKMAVVTIMLNAGAVLLESMGMSEVVGVELMPGAGSEISDFQDNIETITAGGIGNRLFGLAAMMFDIFTTTIQMIMTFPQMLMNLGIPDPIVVFVTAPLYTALAIEIAYVAR